MALEWRCAVLDFCPSFERAEPQGVKETGDKQGRLATHWS